MRGRAARSAGAYSEDDYARATTDSNPAVDFENMGPGVGNLLSIFQAFGEWSGEQMQAHFSGMRYGDLKKQVAEMVVAKLGGPIQARYREIAGGSGVPGWRSARGSGGCDSDRGLDGGVGEAADGIVYGGLISWFSE